MNLADAQKEKNKGEKSNYNIRIVQARKEPRKYTYNTLTEDKCKEPKTPLSSSLTWAAV